MARPKTKAELLKQSQENYAKLMRFINGLSREEQEEEFPDGMLNRNIRDVLCHLHEWHLMMLTWYQIGMTGEKPPMPAEGYTWKTTPDLNIEIRKKYEKLPLEKAITLFSISHEKQLSLINQHSNEELFTKKYYKWTGSTSLGAYLISATSSHYDWALKLIKKALS